MWKKSLSRNCLQGENLICFVTALSRRNENIWREFLNCHHFPRMVSIESSLSACARPRKWQERVSARALILRCVTSLKLARSMGTAAIFRHTECRHCISYGPIKRCHLPTVGRFLWPGHTNSLHWILLNVCGRCLPRKWNFCIQVERQLENAISIHVISFSFSG